ncbi:MAG: DUF2817 domain-containing protein [Betaproteobacteria bacterium]|nr:DUF2817 domain-containing protein [Betaproteobacteria bacterium]
MILRSNSEDYYSQSYDEARTRFIAAAKAAGAQLNAYPLAAASALGGDLNIDVAQLGAADAPTLIVSSGVHGIEGFFGSAVQLALLEHLAPARARAGLRLVLIHALNPYGFKHLRRVNEHNVDLNRNFLLSAAEYHGAPHGYARLEAFLNPPSRPTRLERFRVAYLASGPGNREKHRRRRAIRISARLVLRRQRAHRFHACGGRALRCLDRRGARSAAYRSAYGAWRLRPAHAAGARHRRVATLRLVCADLRRG